MRPADTVARVGGDEFVVLAHLPDKAQAEALRTRLIHRLDTATTASGQRIRLGASAGLATTRDPSSDSRDLLLACHLGAQA
ncbi:diguanylate cyclase domain-containing protein [Saccharopolyspora mangrovi]|uniref:Diguanylate cyclase n=1 Tax=Saccharopolyspora mangrovi TaxID=3082379 RepID=A0ABU6AEV4_9PSEU|nr:diguanylate cyclase [Saccharopolyspora sp. S2-29]MEB3370069.1 diguanylate cyclase [Saccharopolyspora sp. S2-29]